MNGDEIQDNYRPTQALNNRTVYHHVAGQAVETETETEAPCAIVASNCTMDSDCCSGRRFNRTIFGLSFGFKNGLRLHFDCETRLNYPLLEQFLSVGESQAKTGVIFQAETLAKIVLLNWVP